MANRATVDNGVDEDIDPQEAYYVSLLARFEDLSARLQNPPPADLIPLSVANTAQALNTGYNSKWRSILNTQPSMVLISLLSQETVLQGLRMLETRLTVERLSECQSLGLWSWGLLGRCRDAGQMGSEEIGMLRDLGKKAIWLLRVMKAGVLRMEEDEGSHTDSDSEYDGENRDLEALQGSDLIIGTHGVEPQSTSTTSASKNGTAEISADTCTDLQSADGLEAARAKLLASLPSDSRLPTTQTSNRASPSASPPLNDVYGSSEDPALDMIITIVGECYGQRDLLEGRIVWGELDYD